MITIFNRKELIITYDTAIQSKVRDILASDNIDYIIKVRNVHPYALNLRSYEYKIYIHKKDYEQAVYWQKKKIESLRLENKNNPTAKSKFDLVDALRFYTEIARNGIGNQDLGDICVHLYWRHCILGSLLTEQKHTYI